MSRVVHDVSIDVQHASSVLLKMGRPPWFMKDGIPGVRLDQCFTVEQFVNTHHGNFGTVSAPVFHMVIFGTFAPNPLRIICQLVMTDTYLKMSAICSPYQFHTLFVFR